MWIKDMETNMVRPYGIYPHDSLVMSEDGSSLHYYNMQIGEGSKHGSFKFVADREGTLPEDIEACREYGELAYWNIGGFEPENKKDEKRLGNITNHDIMKIFGVKASEPKKVLKTDEDILKEVERLLILSK
ncbi:hypothetical protein bpr_II078 (plasmid) [Butyrivibrio proteoclasticus B316]|uniref:Uncharacterized protein n=1 Tax=Butyrivibrio proteoclasticus (strain ATCC 51982 / DSM 14932 / B316) TaxID=515622 RepID=E0S3N6_BUTPB|nr:hypothetical protein [Butyrivibrio proteoclasticus]ADL36018.1 hypothetical protein bpr_II078 [Butyrivibrio proteoclasticus B316]